MVEILRHHDLSKTLWVDDLDVGHFFSILLRGSPCDVGRVLGLAQHFPEVGDERCYNNVGLHTAFAVLCTAYSIYLAASWYDYALTRKFSSKLRKKIRSLHPDKEKARAL